jgi:hypothetical protein
MSCCSKRGVRTDKTTVTSARKEILILICSEANSRLHLSASMMACSFSVSSPAVMNLPIWNPAFMKSGFSARVSTTQRIR